MRKTARSLSKYLVYVLLVSGVVTQIYVISRSTPLSNDVEAAMQGLGEKPSLDVDVATDAGTYSTRLDQYKRTRNYKYLDTGNNTTEPSTQDIQFGSVIAQVNSGWHNGLTPDTNRENPAIQNIDWHRGDPRYFRDVLTYARVTSYLTDDIGVQYSRALEENARGVRGYFYVSSNSSEDCYNYNQSVGGITIGANRPNFRTSNVWAGARFSTLSGGGTGLPPDSSGIPIYYRIGRGKINYLFGNANGVVALVESRIYYDNVCTFSTVSDVESQTEIQQQRLVNVSFPIIALLVYKHDSASGGKTWVTKHISQQVYKASIIPGRDSSGNLVANKHDLFFWGSFAGELKETVKISKASSYAFNAQPDFSYFRNFFPTYDQGGGGIQGNVVVNSVEDVFGAQILRTSSPQVAWQCNGFNCGWDAGPALSAFEPIYKDGYLYLTLYNTRPTIGKSLIIRYASARDLNLSADLIYERQWYTDTAGTIICKRFSAVISTGTPASTCVGATSTALGARPVNRVTLADGSELTFDKANPQITPISATSRSGFKNGAIEVPNNLIQLGPAYSVLFASFFSGSQFTENSVTKSLVAIGDNGGLPGDSTSPSRVIWLGGENLGSAPGFKSIAFNCVQSGNPYKISVSLVTESTSANIVENRLILRATTLVPEVYSGADGALDQKMEATVNVGFNASNAVTAYRYEDASNTWQAYGSTLHQRENEVIGSRNASGTPVVYDNSVNYVISNASVSALSRTRTFNFTIDFNRNNTLYKPMAGNIDVYVLVRDAGGVTNDLTGTSTPVKVQTSAFNSYNNCATPYFKTSAGDFRSKEQDTIRSNKYWQRNISASTFDEKANPNTGVASTYKSDFTYEKHYTDASCVQRISGFCATVSSGSSYLEKDTVLDSVVSSLRGIEASTKVDIKKDIGSTCFSSRCVNLSSISSAADTVLIIFESYSDVTIVDDLAAPDKKIIVWCKTTGCKLRLRAVKTFASGAVLHDSASGRLSYPESEVAAFAKNQVRLYVNHNSDTTTNPSAGRQVVLEELDSYMSNYYFGSILTSGFFFSDTAKNTNILKGLVISRGIVANATGPNDNGLYFDDFWGSNNAAKPFLHIAYDPKYLVSFGGVFTKPAAEIKGEFIGL